MADRTNLSEDKRSRVKLPRSWRRFLGAAKNSDGAVLIEFGLLALPFFAIVGAIIETALLMLASVVLDAAVNDAARNIRTGEAHTASQNISGFRTQVCDNLYGLFDCSKLRIFVSPVASFGSASLGNNVVDLSNGNWDDAENYNHGGSSSVMLAQVYYKWPTYLDFFSFDLASLPDNTHLLGAARLFQNEPF